MQPDWAAFRPVAATIAVCLAVVAAFMTALWSQWREERSFGRFAVLCVAWAALLGWAVARDAPALGWALAVPAPPLLAVIGWVLLRRFVGALRQSEALAADLGRRVDAKRRELEETDARLRVVERARILAEERERIVREMHDGLGSYLVSTLALLDAEADDVPRAAVDRAIRAALADLRLMIGALEPLEGDLAAALAMLRQRMQPQLESAGIRVDWQVSDVAPIHDFGPRRVLQVLRILQEAVTNVLKHGAARSITVRTAAGAPDGAVAVEITDDGRGLGATRAAAGRGLQHMHERAAAIGATLEVVGSTAGTTVRLRIPVAGALRA
jgi:signal transduction histidine kinase